MENNRIREEARVQQMMLEKAGSAAENGLYALEDGAVRGYRAVENAVVGGYGKIEHAVVSSYEKIESAFVNAFLRHEGESVQEAKARLRAEEQARREGRSV